MIAARLTTVLLLLAATARALGAQDARPHTEASLLSRPASLEVRQVTLEEALLQLSRRSGVPIAFSPDLLRGPGRVSCSCRVASVRQALDTLLVGTGLVYAETGQRVVVVPPAVAPAIPARPRIPSPGLLLGEVRSAADSQPITGAQVQVVGQLEEVRSDALGRFSLALREGDYDLHVRALGFAPQELRGLRVGRGDTTAANVLLEPAALTLDEIVVTPSTYAILAPSLGGVQHTLSRENLNAHPHLGDDLFRASGRLPGIVPHDVTAKLSIRGSQSNEVLQTLDGVELYEPFHLKDIDGALSIVNTEAVDGVDLRTGGFTAEYGERLAGVLAMRSATPPPDRTTTTLGASLMHLTLMSQGGFAAGRGTWLTSVRRGYLDIALRLMGETEKILPRYHDLFAKVQYQLGSRHLVSVHALYGGDTFSMVEDDATEVDSRWSSGYAWVNWRAEWGGDLSSETIVSGARVTRNRSGRDYSDDLTYQNLSVEDHGTFEHFGVKQDWRLLASQRLLLRWGLNLGMGSARYSYYRWRLPWIPNFTDPAAPPWSQRRETLAVYASPSGRELGAYLTGRFRVTDRLTTELGARLDRKTQAGDNTVSPRVNVAWDLAPRTALRAAWGLYHQSHGLQDLNVAQGDTLFYPAQRAEHRVLGLSHVLRDGTALRIEAYERRTAHPWPEYRDLVPNLSDVVQEEYLDEVVRLVPTRRVARGIEVLLSRESGGRVAWSASYALASSADEIGGTWVPSPFDQRHTVKLEGAFKPSPRWELAAIWYLHSPWPYTAQRWVRRTLANGEAMVERVFGPIDRERLSPYHRLDIRASRRFRVGRGTLSVFFDVFNLYDRQNAEAFEWRDVYLVGDRVEGTPGFRAMLGALPNIGARWEF